MYCLSSRTGLLCAQPFFIVIKDRPFNAVKADVVHAFLSVSQFITPDGRTDGTQASEPAPRKYAVPSCGHLDPKSAITARNDEFDSSFSWLVFTFVN